MKNSTRILQTGGDRVFFLCLALLGSVYGVLLGGMLIANLFYTSPGHILAALRSPEIQYAIRLSLITCSLSALFSLWVAVPLGYLLARTQFPGRRLLDTLLDIPIVLPPLVIGLSLLILFQTPPGRWIEQWIPVTYAVPSVVLAQFMVAAAFAIRTLRTTFDSMDPRQEQVALTLGCSRAQAFWMVAFPRARRGLFAAATLAWARSLGEFGPILVFSGATRFKTEVLSTTVFLELSVGNLEAAVAVSLLMVATAIGVLLILRIQGLDTGAHTLATHSTAPSHHRPTS